MTLKEEFGKLKEVCMKHKNFDMGCELCVHVDIHNQKIDKAQSLTEELIKIERLSLREKVENIINDEKFLDRIMRETAFVDDSDDVWGMDTAIISRTQLFNEYKDILKSEILPLFNNAVPEQEDAVQDTHPDTPQQRVVNEGTSSESTSGKCVNCGHLLRTHHICNQKTHNSNCFDCNCKQFLPADWKGEG